MRDSWGGGALSFPLFHAHAIRDGHSCGPSPGRCYYCGPSPGHYYYCGPSPGRYHYCGPSRTCPAHSLGSLMCPRTCPAHSLAVSCAPPPPTPQSLSMKSPPIPLPPPPLPPGRPLPPPLTPGRPLPPPPLTPGRPVAGLRQGSRPSERHAPAAKLCRPDGGPGRLRTGGRIRGRSTAAIQIHACGCGCDEAQPPSKYMDMVGGVMQCSCHPYTAYGWRVHLAAYVWRGHFAAYGWRGHFAAYGWRVHFA